MGGRAQCRELALPPSDLAHRSALCAVYSQSEGQTPCCLAVSPEGVVRYWPSIAHEGSSTETSAELGGQECYSLTDLHPVGCVLATTTSTVLLIHHTGHGVACRRFQAPAGLLGGLGRRMSSLLWGSLPAGGQEAKMVRVVGRRDPHDPEIQTAFVLTSNGLQKWQLTLGEPDRLYYECDVSSLARERFWPEVWGGNDGTPAWLRIWLVDLHILDEQHVVILMAAVNQNDGSSSRQVHYGLGVLKVATDAPPIRLVGFTLIQQTYALLGDNDEPAPYRLVTVSDNAYIFNHDSVLAMSLQPGGQEDRITFSAGDGVLGAGATEETPLFFSSHHGVVSLTPIARNTPDNSINTLNDSMVADRAARLSDSLNVSVSVAGLDNLTMSESKTDQLKAAFLLYCKRNAGQSQSIIEEIFPLEESGEAVDSSLDRYVVALSKDLIDDFPASDPRWVESLPASQAQGVGSSMSLLVLHQLQDKLTAHEFFVTFLKNIGLWSRLGAVTVRGSPMATTLRLAEHAEKTVAAVTLRTVHNDLPAVVDSAIKVALCDRDVTASGNLTDQDHFYREISRIDDIVDGLVAVVQHSVSADSPRELVTNVVAVNTVVLTVIKEALATRNKKVSEFSPTGPSSSLEYLPWTATTGPKGRRGQLMTLVKASLQHGISAADDSQDRAAIYRQVVELSDLLLDGYSGQLASLSEGDKKYEAVMSSFSRDRESLITPLVDRKLYDEAASLAEKYREFDALVRLCEETGNKEKLEQYMDMFKDNKFSDHVFAWYVKEGKQGRLLSSTSSGRNQELGQFLAGHSGLSWLHDINTGSFQQAAETLKSLAMQETDILARKKTQLSLSKLAALASDAPDEEIEVAVDNIECEAGLISAQEQLPRTVLDSFGFDRGTMRVLTPQEMIEMYISDENCEGDHIDFKKALDLLNYVTLDEEEKEKLRLHIWSRSVTRNTWTDIDVDNPIDSVRDTVFFRLVEFAFMQGVDLREYLPSPERLLESEELGELQKNQNFQYLIQTGYQHIQKVCAF